MHGLPSTGRGKAREQLRVWHRARQGTLPLGWGRECSSQPCLGLEQGNVGSPAEPAWLLSQAERIFGVLGSFPLPVFLQRDTSISSGSTSSRDSPQSCGDSSDSLSPRLMPAPPGTLQQSISTPPGPGERCFQGLVLQGNILNPPSWGRGAAQMCFPSWPNARRWELLSQMGESVFGSFTES